MNDKKLANGATLLQASRWYNTDTCTRSRIVLSRRGDHLNPDYVTWIEQEDAHGNRATHWGRYFGSDIHAASANVLDN